MSFKSVSFSLKSCLTFAVEVAKKAGAEIKAAFYDGTNQRSAEWKAVADLVTDVDRRVESEVFSSLREKYPTHAFIGEESAHTTEVVDPKVPTWCVDPIDGTTNFVHGYPQCCISIALFVDGTPAVGVIFNPVLDELFTAIRGKGAYLNGTRKLHVSSSKGLKEAVISTNVGTMRDERGAAFITDNINRLLHKKVLSMRMTGSSAMSLASVACGRLCAFYEWGIHIWDFAAGALLVTEAGGIVRDPSGKELDYSHGCVLGGTPGVVEEIAQTLLPKDF